MTKVRQHPLEFSAPVHQPNGRRGNQRAAKRKRSVLVIDYQTWLSLTDHLVARPSVQGCAGPTLEKVRRCDD
jgi:hypothetical protein